MKNRISCIILASCLIAGILPQRVWGGTLSLNMLSALLSSFEGELSELLPEQDLKPAAGRPNDYAEKENPFFAKNQQAEEEKGFPEFSLDDILSARDEEFSRQNYFSNPDPIRSPDIDETVVIDTNRFSPFDQQSLDFDRKK